MASRHYRLEWKTAEHEGECVGAPSGGPTWCKHDSHFNVKELWRAHFVPAPAYFTLNHCCKLINDAFNGFGCFLVGSAMDGKNYRDVDVRFIMRDEEYKHYFHELNGGAFNPMWSLLCITISQWLSSQTGLQVDFQFQTQSHSTRMYGGQARNALGIFLDYPGERPTDVKA